MVAIWYSSRGPEIASQELGSTVLTETRNANAYNPPDTSSQPPEVGPTGMEKVQAYRWGAYTHTGNSSRAWTRPGRSGEGVVYRQTDRSQTGAESSLHWSCRTNVQYVNIQVIERSIPVPGLILWDWCGNKQVTDRSRTFPGLVLLDWCLLMDRS